MNKKDKIKLSIYESSLSDVMKYRLTELIDIYEASKHDADKAEEIGRQNLTLRKGANISELDRKHKIRSSARSTKGTIPNYGANPRFSNDADEHAIEKYKMSKKYKNIDIDSSLKDIKNETKKRILTERLKQGKNISGNISEQKRSGMRY